MDSPDAILLFLGKRVLLSFNPLSGYRSGLQCSSLRLMPSRGCVFRHCSASIASPGAHLLRPLLTSPRRSAPIARHSAPIFRSTEEISRGKTRHCRCADAGFTTCILLLVDGGLRSHVSARPRCITPTIRFLFVAPPLRVQLPSDPTSR